MLDRPTTRTATATGTGTAVLDRAPAAAPPVRVPQRRPSGYEHLAPLFAERARLPADHPRRAELRTLLITGYLPVAQHIARRHAYRGENLEDLEQVATLGLIEAVDRFDPARGPDFLSFAVPTINGGVLRHYRDRAWTIRVPRRLRELQSTIHQAAADLSQRLGRAPRPSEIAAELGMPLATVIDGLHLQNAGRCLSLDEPADDDGGSRGRTRFGAALGRTDPELELVEYREALGPLLDQLPDRERTMVLLRFFGGLTQHEIAQRLGISQMHVSRLLAATLAGLRGRLTAEV
jgi:RNA polymerase sigma-B factor